MLVVAVAAVLVCVGIPTLVRVNHRVACIQNQWALEHARDAFIKEQRLTRQVLMVDICGADKKLAEEPRCPYGGIYALGGLGEEVVCSLGTKHQRHPTN